MVAIRAVVSEKRAKIIDTISRVRFVILIIVIITGVSDRSIPKPVTCDRIRIAFTRRSIVDLSRNALRFGHAYVKVQIGRKFISNAF